jgi:hypothetical protein
LHRFFAADHGRLDVLLRRAIADPARVDLAPFAELRAGILRHIGMEEKYLFVMTLALSRRQWAAADEGGG